MPSHAVRATFVWSIWRSVLRRRSSRRSRSERPRLRAPAMTKSSTAQQRLRQLVSPGEPPAQVQRVAQVDAEGRQVLGQAGGGARVLAPQLGDKAPQIGFRLLGRSGFVERGPVGGLDSPSDVLSLWHFF